MTDMMTDIESGQSFRGTEGFNAFADYVGLTRHEKEEREHALKQSYMPFSSTFYYADLIKNSEDHDREQLLNVVLPPVGEKNFTGRFDPYGNRTYIQENKNFIQHKYKPTILVHITDYCVAHCQFCYKVNEIKVEKTNSGASKDKISNILAYLDEHPEVNNILFTGGDPAAIKNSLLIKYIDSLIRHKNIRVLRFATKTIAFEPRKFLDKDILNFFSSIKKEKDKQIAVIAQINHPAELTKDTRKAIMALMESGVQVRGQPAIMRGINDSVDTLTRLQQQFLDARIISYYLTVFMPVRGVEQYGLTLHKAYANVAESRRRLSGLEKKGVLLASHDFGKIELVGFLPDSRQPRKIVLKWHQAARPEYIPESLKNKIPHQSDDVFILDYKSEGIYCIDHLFKFNNLPYFDSNGSLRGEDCFDREKLPA